MIKLDRVNKYFNRFRRNSNHVINNTSLTFDDTGLVALLGPSGCGKTTLLNAIGGLDKISSGRIYVNGKKISGHNIHRIDKLRNLNIGYIFQDYKLVDNMSVFDNVALSLKTIGLKNPKEIEKRVHYVLECVGMYRYRKRPASMLSGGERQRVGIARAIVKNPNIIIADEPTGNLDSKNSLEIMNIIKKISEDRLVILVTHEVNLAKFYASRIIEIEDGKVINDYINDHEDNLDYSIDNNIYLKDMNKQDKIDFGIDVYRDKNDSLDIEIVLKGNNIFIRSKNDRKIEVVDDNTSIEFIDDHYKKMAKKDLDNIKFDFSILKSNHRLRYSSIFNPFTFITNGFNKVLNYSLVKKLLLIGFFLSGIYIMISTSRIAANMTIKDKDFVTYNKNYIVVNTNKVLLDDYNKYSSMNNVNYVIPGDSAVTFKVKVDDYYQTSKINVTMTGSLSSIDMITKDDLISGRMPENDHEIIIDKMVIDRLKNEVETAKMVGLIKNKDFLDRVATITNLSDFKIVGISNLESPSIYVDRVNFTDIIYNNVDSDQISFVTDDDTDETSDYQYFMLFANKVYLTEGRWPDNDYEVMINKSEKENYPLNKEMSKKINGVKLKVVGYYDSLDQIDKYLVNNNMMRILLLKKSKNMMIYSNDKEATLNELIESGVNAEDSYASSRNSYIKSREMITQVQLTSSAIILAISLIEIVLMLRSSFLSRIKEVGIFRAIGLKKKDIYIMFSGEIVAITTFASLPGVLICAYICNQISQIKGFESELIINKPLVLGTILLIYIFNLFCGLLPVIFTLRKRPAEILSRVDAD
ncbi:MAG: ABC transporter ATP-binding protein/permease [Bacilli bacterium]|nr:ABC transporter ATP-binding protein/permease [Bacilli bacterium]